MAYLLAEDRALGRAAADYIKTVDPWELSRYFLNASMNALYQGDSDSAWVMRNLVNGPDAYGDHLIHNAGIMFRERPNIVKYFTDDFNRAVASRVQSQPPSAH